MDGKDNNNSDDKKGGKKDDKVEGLTRLEQDILAKSRATGGSGAAARPGVESMSYSTTSRPTSGLTQLEQDIAAKQNLRGAGVAPTAAALSQLEQDIATKTQSRGGSASRPGAVSAGGGTHITQLERDIAAKTQGQSAAATNPSKTLTQLEQDIAAKTKAREGGAPPLRPGAVSSGGMGNLTQLEQGIIAKTQSHDSSHARMSQPGAMSSVGVDSLNQLEDNIRNKTNSMTAPVAPTNAALYQLESDISAKLNAATGGVAVRPSAYMSSDLNNLESEIALKMQAQDAYTTNGIRRDIAPPPAVAMAPQSDFRDSYDRQLVPETTVYNNANSNFNSYQDNGYSDVPTPPSYAPGVRPDDIAMNDPEAPLYPPLGPSVDEPEIGGIEAFVAENVIDATEVAVIMSDEEEEVELKKRQRKLMIRMGLVVIVVLVAVIVPIALLTGGDEVEITPSPTLSPTNFPTLSPTTIELTNVINSLAIKGISQLSDLQSRSSPQGKAVEWIVNDDPYVDSKGFTDLDDEFIQRYALAVFYFSLGGEEWSACHRTDDSCSATGEVNGWLTGTPECSWFVVRCNNEGFVNAIEFVEASQDESFKGRLTPLVGSMPSEIGLLTSLERLIIADMKVNGPILDNISGAIDLKILDLHSNNFTGSISETFSKEHPSLSYINLQDNQLTGEIPASIGNLTNLTTLILQKNGIRGSIPSEIAVIPTIQFFDVGDNQLTGKIPVELYDSKFVTLRMTNNVLEGSISTFIGTMFDLTDYTVGSSKMTGVIPTEMYQVTKLKVLDLHNSSFTGPLPESGFGNFTDLRRFEVQGNDFTGSIPTVAIAKMTNLEYLQLQDNDKLTGSITAEICSLRGTTPTSLQFLIVGCSNECFDGCCNENLKCEKDLYN